jgi:cytochrome c oxidase cbb3-type subunit 1
MPVGPSRSLSITGFVMNTTHAIHETIPADLNTAYNYSVVRKFTIATLIWGILGMSMGVFLAAQLVWPELGFGLPWTTFGRLRPVHTNLVIFAFGGGALFATSFYVVQRTSRVRLVSDGLANFVFWGWQVAILAMIITYPLGYTTSKEYAEMEWPIALLVAVVWLAYAAVFFGTIAKRNVKHIYVGNWFYGAFIVVTGMVHVINHVCSPISLFKSYSNYSGATDAMIQWWYGHSVVGFILSVGFLGMMYYYVPKQAGRPIYSYRLSVIHFWAIITLYIWAGAHHLHYTALPDWAQSLGMAMSIILLAPSWGGMINGMMTLSGAWHKLRTDPILRFLIVSLAFYGMSTFEGPMMAIKTVNALSHYTDWTIGHVHAGALGWVAMISIGTLYHMIPKLYGREQMYSIGLINVHFWLSTIGTVLYIASMWVNGITEGLMWRAINDDGTLTYSFVEALQASHPGFIVRFIGGATFASGMLLMAYNTWRTVRAGEKIENMPVAEPVT